MRTAKLCDRLKQAMELRELKQADLVENYGFDKGQLSSWLSGRYEPRPENLEKLAKALDVDPAWLDGFDVPATDNLPKRLQAYLDYLDKLNNDNKERHALLIYHYDTLSRIGRDALLEILSSLTVLNDLGIKEATKRIDELTYFPQYKKDETERQAAHAIQNATKEDEQHDMSTMNEDDF